jgi:hypothetical protein
MSAKRRWSGLSFVVLAVACIGAPALADQSSFHSPSGNIQCELDFDVGPSVANVAYCQTFEPAQAVRLKPNGKIKVCKGMACLGDGPQDALILGFGEHITQGPFRCTSRRNGMRCTLEGGRGFRISRAGIKRLG